MGRIFLEHAGGLKLYNCNMCKANLTNLEHRVSRNFIGATGRAYLFEKVVNIKCSEIQDRDMLTGRYLVRDAWCKSCGTKLGWKYEFAILEAQKHKEGWNNTRVERKGNTLKEFVNLPRFSFLGKVILERALIEESDGIEEIK